MDSQTVDTGPSGFLSIFGKPTPESEAPEPEALSPQDEPSAADSSAPEVPDQDLSAADLVAARLAASLDADGIALPAAEPTPASPEDETHPLLLSPDGEPSLDAMTPEELRALAEEAIRLRGDVTTQSRHEAARKVMMAETAAIAQVQSAYEREVLARADAHYDAYYDQQYARIEDEAENHHDPRQYRREQAALLRRRVDAAKQEWVSGQTEAYEQRAQQAALMARKSVPEMRQLYAEELVRQSGLPAGAVAEVLKVRNTDDFPARVEELIGIRDALLAERQKNQQTRRVEANKALRDTTPRTATTGRLPGGKPPAYKGTAAEGAAILATFRQRS